MSNRQIFNDLSQRGQIKRIRRRILNEHDENDLSSATVGDRAILNQIQMTLAHVCAQQETILEELQQLRTEQQQVAETWAQQKTILEDLQQLKTERQKVAEDCAQQKTILEELRQLRAEQQKVAEATAGTPTPSWRTSLPDRFGALPLTTCAGFGQLQDQLDDQMTEQFLTLLTSLGGRDLQHAIHNMLRRIMVDELATMFSFSGKVMAGVSKTPFGKTKICKCILVAVQRMFGPREATETKSSTIVGKWLQQAKHRVMRREKKRSLEQVEGSVEVVRDDNGKMENELRNYTF